MGKVWQVAAKSRNDFADMVESLDAEQLDADTFCEGWTPKHVLAHLVGFVDQSLPKFFLNIARHKFDFDAAVDGSARRYVDGRSVDEMLAALRAQAGKSSPMPGFPEALTVTDVAAHTQDVRRALKLDGELDEDVLAMACDFLTTDPKAQKIFEVPKFDGLAFEATDSDYRAGSGAVIESSREAFMMAMFGRPVWDDLKGEGVAELRSRL